MVMPIYCKLVLTVLVNWRRDTSLEGKTSFCFASASCGQMAGWLGLKAATSRRPSPPCTLSPSLNQFQCLVLRLPWWLRRQRIACNAGDRVRSLVGKIPLEKRTATHRYSGLEEPTDCIGSPWGRKESDATERLALKIQQLQGARGQMGKKGGGFPLREEGLGREVMKRGTRRRGGGSQDPGKRGHNA